MPAEEKDIPLPLSGRRVERLYIDAAFGIEFMQGRETFEFRVDGEFKLTRKGAEKEYSPQGEDVAGLGEALRLLHKTARSGIALKDGTLEITFTDDTVLVVPPLQHFEAWTVAGPKGFKVVSLPGGGLAVWSARDEADHEKHG